MMIVFSKVTYLDDAGHEGEVGSPDDPFLPGPRQTAIAKALANVTEKTLRWQLATPPDGPVNTFPYAVWHAALSPDRSHLVVQCFDVRLDPLNKLWVMRAGEPARTVPPPATAVVGGLVVEGYQGFDLVDGRFVVDCRHSREKVISVVFDPVSSAWGPVVGSGTVGMR